jgi:hypothetical protein
MSRCHFARPRTRSLLAGWQDNYLTQHAVFQEPVGTSVIPESSTSHGLLEHMAVAAATLLAHSTGSFPFSRPEFRRDSMDHWIGTCVASRITSSRALRPASNIARPWLAIGDRPQCSRNVI